MNHDQQLILVIDREFASGGREIADRLSAVYGIPVYEKNILNELNLPGVKDVEDLYSVDEAPRWKLASRTVRGLTNSNEHALAKMEFDFIRKMADEGKSFILIGHCGEELLKENPNMISLFVSADPAFKIERIKRDWGLDDEEAYAKMKRHDRKRKYYHNSYARHKWGDSRCYDLCIHSSELGTENSAKLIENYISMKRGIC